MSDNFRRTILRFAIVFSGIMAMFGLVVFKIMYIQTVQREQWEKEGAKVINTSIKTIPAIRGNIYDANQQLLASSIPQYRLYMDTRIESLQRNNGEVFKQYVDSIATGLSEILGDKTPAEYREIMVKSFNRKTTKANGKCVRGSYVKLHNQISYTQRKAINQLPLVRKGFHKSGIAYEENNKRSNPFGSLGKRTIGDIYGESGKGTAGIEKAFEQYLCGKDGSKIRQRVAGRWDYIPLREAENGADVYTTLDVNLMDICESSLRKQLATNQADWGCVILMEVKTGEIKAICNLDLKDGQYYERANHAVMRVEPGSTFKTISLMAALDDGKIDMDDQIQVWKNGWMYYNLKHTDAHPADTIYSIRNSLAVSSNIALARIVTDGYNGSAQKFVNKLLKMGICDSIDYIIPGAEQGRIDIPKDSATISKMAYGYSVEMSPLHMLTVYNGIANNGKMISPLLVKEVRKDNKCLIKYNSETISHLCSHSTLTAIKECLHDVVWDNDLGTASVYKWKGAIAKYKAQSSLVPIAGKTGTAQVFENGQYLKSKHRMSFVGYFPEDNPQYSCICVIHAPRNKGYYDAGMDCGSVVRHIAEKTMAYSSEYVIVDGQLVFKHK